MLHYNPYRSLFGTVRPDHYAAITDALGNAALFVSTGDPSATPILGGWSVTWNADSDQDGVPDAVDKCPFVADDQEEHHDEGAAYGAPV